MPYLVSQVSETMPHVYDFCFDATKIYPIDDVYIRKMNNLGQKYQVGPKWNENRPKVDLIFRLQCPFLSETASNVNQDHYVVL